jgi:hypothetical protein
MVIRAILPKLLGRLLLYLIIKAKTSRRRDGVNYGGNDARVLIYLMV